MQVLNCPITERQRGIMIHYALLSYRAFVGQGIKT